MRFRVEILSKGECAGGGSQRVPAATDMIQGGVRICFRPPERRSNGSSQIQRVFFIWRATTVSAHNRPLAIPDVIVLLRGSTIMCSLKHGYRQTTVHG